MPKSPPSIHTTSVNDEAVWQITESSQRLKNRNQVKTKHKNKNKTRTIWQEKCPPTTSQTLEKEGKTSVQLGKYSHCREISNMQEWVWGYQDELTSSLDVM